MSEGLILAEDDFVPTQEPKYVITRLPEPILFSNVVRGITEDLPNDELTISADDLPNINNDNETSL